MRYSVIYAHGTGIKDHKQIAYSKAYPQIVAYLLFLHHKILWPAPSLLSQSFHTSSSLNHGYGRLSPRSGLSQEAVPVIYRGVAASSVTNFYTTQG